MTEAEVVPGGRRVGEQPRPRVLLSWAGDDRDQMADALAKHAPTVREIASFEEVNQDDYDVLVTDCMSKFLVTGIRGPAPVEPARHLFVVSFVRSSRSAAWDRADVVRNPRAIAIVWHGGHKSESVEIPNDLPSAVVDLVSDDLVPAARDRPAHTTFSTAGWSGDGLPALADLVALSSVPVQDAFEGRRPTPVLPPPTVLHPLLRTPGPDSKVLAAWYLRSESSEGWVLPSEVKRPWDWVAAAIRHWSMTYGRFPLVGGWWEDPTWQTRPETDASERRGTLKAELASLTTRLEAEIESAEGELEAASREASDGLRRLLTEKGEPLKDAVASALGQLGYLVKDRDQEEPPDPGGKIEDLGVADPDDPGADPIIEVKGYDSGAKAGDIGLIMRHLRRAEAAGRSPSAVWWVIDHWRNKPPGDRGPVLPGDNNMIGEHAADDVPLVVIDSTDLFRAVRAVEDGLVEAGAVRASLRAARGRWGGT